MKTIATIATPEKQIPNPFARLTEKFTLEHYLVLGAIGVYGLYSLYKNWQGEDGKPPIKGSAYWAKKEHIDRAKQAVSWMDASDDPRDIGFMLGNLPLANAVLSTIWYGAPQKGKTYGCLNQKIYENLVRHNSQVIVDVQYPESAKLFIPIVQALGYDPENIYIWVPGEDTSQIYNPVEHAIGDLADVQAEQQYENSRPVGAKPDEFFSDAAKLFLSASMCMSNAISNQHGIPFGFLLIKAIGGLNSIVKRLEYNKERLREVDFWAYDKFAQLIATGTSEKTVDSTRGAMGNMVGKLSTGVLRSMVGKTSFPLYLDGPKLLIIGCRSQLCPVVAPYLMSCLKTVVQVNAVHGRQTPIQIAFDELPKMDYKSLPEDVNELRKFGVYFNVAAQTPMQLKKRYGNEGLGALMTGFGHSGWYSTGIAEKEASEYLEHILGKEKYREKQYSSGYSGGKSNNSTSNPIKERPLMPAHEIRKMPPQNLIWLSPGFSKTNGSTWDAQIKEVGIPWKTKIQVDPHYAAMVKMAAQEWPFVEAQLKKYSPQVSIEELQEYLVEAERIANEYFVLPPSEEELAEQSAIEDAAKEIDDFYASLNNDSSAVLIQVPNMKHLQDSNALNHMAQLASEASGKTITPEDVESLLPYLRQIFENFELTDEEQVMRLNTASILALIDSESKSDVVTSMREVLESELSKFPSPTNAG